MKFERKIKTIFYGMEFSHGIRRAIVSALALIYFLSLGFNIVAITTLFALSTLIMTFFEFPTGAIADYDSRKKSMMISFFLIFISFLGIFLFKEFWILAGFWILNDIAWTFTSGANSAWAIDAINGAKHKSKIANLISRRDVSERLGLIVGGIIGFFVIAINFRFIWLFISILYLVLFFIIGKYMEERNFKPEKVPHNYLKKVLIKAKESVDFIIHKKNRQLRALMLGDFFGIMSEAAFFLAVPLLFVQIFNVKVEQFSGIIAIVAALTIISPIIAEKVTNKKGIRKSMVIAGILTSALIISFSLSPSVITAIVFLVILKFNLAIVGVVGETATHVEFDSKIRASLDSATNIIWAISSAMAVFLAGISINFFGVINTLLICGGISFIEAMIYLFGLKKD
jgi:MFS family permease